MIASMKALHLVFRSSLVSGHCPTVMTPLVQSGRTLLATGDRCREPVSRERHHAASGLITALPSKVLAHPQKESARHAGVSPRAALRSELFRRLSHKRNKYLCNFHAPLRLDLSPDWRGAMP